MREERELNSNLSFCVHFGDVITRINVDSGIPRTLAKVGGGGRGGFGGARKNHCYGIPTFVLLIRSTGFG